MGVIGAGLGEVDAADRAQADAIGPAQDLGRERQGQRIARPAPQVELVPPRRRATRAPPPPRLGDLAGVDLELRARAGQAAHARSDHARREPQAQRVAVARGPGDVERVWIELGLDGVALTGELERVERHREVQAAALAGR